MVVGGPVVRTRPKSYKGPGEVLQSQEKDGRGGGEKEVKKKGNKREKGGGGRRCREDRTDGPEGLLKSLVSCHWSVTCTSRDRGLCERGWRREEH